MSRRRHFLTAFIAGLPLLILVLYLARGGGSAVGFAATLVWVAAVLILETVVWRGAAAPMNGLMQDLGVETARAARTALRELRADAATCRDERAHTTELLEDISLGLGDGLLVVTADLSIRLINPVALRFCGADQVGPGSHILDILRDPDAVDAVEAAAAGGSPDPVMMENPRGLWEVHAFPVRGGGAVVLFTDVGLVRRAAEFRRRFVQDLSHELRSPLTVLRTTVEALEDEVEPQTAAMLVRQVERIDRLTAELYELASIEAGEVELELESVRLDGVLREVLGDFQPEAERLGVELQVEIEEQPSCWSDRRGLYRVLSNLVDNAIKYNHRGGRVQVRARYEEGAPVLEVEDNGEGIPSSELKAVLQRFYRVDRARTPGDGGLGLGLAIVKHMVQALGGTLELDSREGVGTTVTLRLPPAPAETE